MPAPDGFDVLRAAKRRNPWVQVLMVTGHSSIERIEAAIEAGASDFLVKPLDGNEFKHVVTECIHRVGRWRKALHQTFRRPAAVESVTL
jgi:DNA-binding NtrC family response regulator